jgi:hypothetical protein
MLPGEGVVRDDMMPERLLDQARGGNTTARGELLELYGYWLRLVDLHHFAVSG